MSIRTGKPNIDRMIGSLQRVLRYAFYDWTREMPLARRFFALTGLVMQGYAFYALWTRSLVWPVLWPTGASLYYASGFCTWWATA